MRRALAQARALATSAAVPYIAAVVVRAGSRAAWGLAVPAVLSVAAYGRYQLLATIAAMAGQLALLGAPQTIVRHAGRRMPVRAILMHAAGLGAVVVLAAGLLVPSVRSASALWILGAFVLATLLASVHGALAKARFAFGTSLHAELAGAGILLVAALAIIARGRFGGPSPGTALIIEAAALACAATVLAVGGARLTTPREGQVLPIRGVLRDVYSVGGLVLLDVVLFRRLEIYFLERSPDGLPAVAVMGLALQIATVAVLVPTALLETWQPRLSIIRRAGGDAAFVHDVRRRARQFAPLMAATLAAGVLTAALAVSVLFDAYRPWRWYIVGFVAIRVACAGAGLYSAALYAVGGQRVLYGPAVIGTVVALAANAALTRPLGLRGAMVAYAVTQVSVAVLTVVAFRRWSADQAGRAAPFVDPRPPTVGLDHHVSDHVLVHRVAAEASQGRSHTAASGA